MILVHTIIISDFSNFILFQIVIKNGSKSNLTLICILQPNVITKFRLLSLLPSGQCINKSYQQNLKQKEMYIEPEKAKLVSFLQTLKTPAVAPYQHAFWQILKLSNGARAEHLSKSFVVVGIKDQQLLPRPFGG